MTWLKPLFLLAAVVLASAFVSDEASAHAGHHHESAIAIDYAENIVQQDQKDADEVQHSIDEEANFDLYSVCLHGCCAGVCAACCVVSAEVNAQVADYYPPKNLMTWLHYQTPDEAISLPDTPPPRV